MTTLDHLLLLSAATVLLLLLFGRHRYAGAAATLLYAGQLALLLKFAGVGYDASCRCLANSGSGRGPVRGRPRVARQVRAGPCRS